MRLTLYYFTRTVKNQIRKLCRTWVAVFLLVCLLFGMLIGLGAAALGELFEDDTEQETIEETLPEESIPMDAETRNAIIELAVGGIALLVLVMAVFTADKSGGSIFLAADVHLLFPAPLKPQTVLLFRLIMQAATSIAATLYFLIYIPNLVSDAGLPIGAALAILGAWFILLVFSKLLSVLLYTVTTTHPTWKKRIRPTLYALVLVLAAAFLLAAHEANGDYFAAARSLFNAPATRYIPVWGWLKGLVMFALSSNVRGALLALAALLLTLVALVAVIWRIKADFYEDAMARSSEVAATQQAVQQGENPKLKKRKKDRSAHLVRDGLTRGAGASVYFHKTLYNRFRFAHLRVFTKTAETYLLAALAVSAALLIGVGERFFPAVALVLGAMTFFRSLGNPISADIAQDSFFLVPDGAHRKVLCSFAGGLVCSALDLLPAFTVGTILLRAHPAEALVWFLLIVSVGAYSDGVGLFIDLSLSTGLSQTVKSLVQILFVYFGLIPVAVLVILGFALDRLLLFGLIAIVFDLVITALSLLVSPLFVERGRK